MGIWVCQGPQVTATFALGDFSWTVVWTGLFPILHLLHMSCKRRKVLAGFQKLSAFNRFISESSVCLLLPSGTSENMEWLTCILCTDTSLKRFWSSSSSLRRAARCDKCQKSTSLHPPLFSAQLCPFSCSLSNARKRDLVWDIASIAHPL